MPNTNTHSHLGTPKHSHKHSHNHSHIPSNEIKIALAAALTGVFMLIEVYAGIISGSLALLADAGHMLTDFASLLLAWFAIKLSRRPANWNKTYGFDRFSILAAFINGLSLFIIAGWVISEAISRFNDPQEILAHTMLTVAIIGLIVNVIAFYVLTKDENENLNIRAAALHVAGDLLGSIAAIIAALVIMKTGWLLIDPLLSILVAIIILKSAWMVVKDSANILLEATPKGLNCESVIETIKDNIDELVDIQHLHAWSITQERPMITLQVALVENINDLKKVNSIKTRIREILEKQFNLSHSTIEMI